MRRETPIKRAACLAVLVLTLAGCSKKMETAEAPMAAPVAADASAPTPAAEKGKPASPLQVTAPMLAYSYDYALEAPADHLSGLMKSHERACLAAGPTVCQIVGQQLEGVGKDQMRGQLSLRATPAWIQAFRSRIGEETKAIDGRVVTSSTASEDLTRSIVDTEAALRARSTLRDRLQALLANRPGKLAELLQVEQELARVQGEIDATQSELAVMRTRVATSALTISYRSSGVLAPEGVWTPVRQAVDDIAATLGFVVAMLVRMATLLAPIGLIGAVVVWFWRRRGRKPAVQTAV